MRANSGWLSISAMALWLCGLVAVAGHAVAGSTWSRTVSQWGVQQIVLHSDHVYANPFTDVQVAATFTSGNRSVQTAGFYDGNGTWKVRLMPGNAGHWNFTTTSTDPELNGITGKFVSVAPPRGEHGPVHVAKTYHFDYADGAPYFPLGTTSYNWLNRDQALQQRTLAALRQSGFTKFRFGLFPKWYLFNRIEPEFFPYVRNADGHFDLERFDPRFFANVEKRIAELNAMGVQADVILFHPYDNWGFAKMDQFHNEAYLRYVVARLAAYSNVWWTMANEYDLMTPRDWDRLTQVVQNSDPYHHPLGIHNMGPWYDHSRPWISHAIVQDGSTYTARSAAIARLRYHKPVLVDEYGYEGNNTQMWGALTGPEEVARHWEITMAGGYASHGETYVHPGGVLWWAAGGELEGESPTRLAFLKSVMMSLPFQDMVPSPELVVNGTLLAEPGQAYLVRIAWSSGSFVLPRTQLRLAGAELFKVELIDPWRMTINLLGYTAAGDQAFTLPMATALLRITAAQPGTGTPAPIGTLTARFAGEAPVSATANPALFKSEPMHYGLEFQLLQLQQNPVARAVLDKYLPKSIPRTGGIATLPLDALLKPGASAITQEQVHALQAELEKIPVD